MKQFIFFLFTIVLISHADGSVSILESRSLADSSTQISCAHLKFRYKELGSILKDLSWITQIPFDASGKIEAHEYISSRLRADPRIIANRPAFEITTGLDDLVSGNVAKPIVAIGILKAVSFELHSPKQFIKLKINAYDICAKGHVDFYLLRDCPVSEGEIPYDWQTCTDIRKLSINLDSFKNKLGLRKREIRRK